MGQKSAHKKEGKQIFYFILICRVARENNGMRKNPDTTTTSKQTRELLIYDLQ